MCTCYFGSFGDPFVHIAHSFLGIAAYGRGENWGAPKMSGVLLVTLSTYVTTSQVIGGDESSNWCPLNLVAPSHPLSFLAF